uniref:MARVEL domain-containing protein n=1 Tax=Graphocephala atropunctata TaxID=36148 RepID=A0A1B6LUV9_9HEMI
MKSITLPQLKTCCGCGSLQSGSKLFGFIALVGSLLICIECAFGIILLHVEPKYVTVTAGALCIELMVHLVHAVTSVCLLLGIYQKKPNLMFWWLISAMVILLMEAFLLPSLLIRALHIHLPYDQDYKMVAITLLMLFDDVYGWLVVLSYYRMLTPQDLV